MSNDNDSNFALIAWIKRQQEKDAKHSAAQIKVRDRDDQVYMKMIGELLPKVKAKQAVMLMTIARWKMDGRNLTDGHRSFITSLYYADSKAS